MMKQITTQLTRLLDINVPVVCAPMAKAANATLAIHVSLGGGFGFIPAGYDGASGVHRELATVKAILDSRGTPHAFHLPVGVGFLGWKLDEAGAEATAMLDAALDGNVQAIWLAFGKDFSHYVAHIRQHDAAHGRKTIVFVVVSSVAEALVAANELKADVIVGQGIESGGHGSNTAPSVFTLVSSILAALPQGAPPVLAAGGITTGAEVAAFLTLGAAGVVMGTRFLLTPDSLLTAAQREALLKADAAHTVRTLSFDQARNTTGWPQGVDGRGLRNQLVDDVERGVDLRTVQERLAAGTKLDQPEYSIIYAGTGVGQIHSIKGVADLLKEIHHDTTQRIHATTHLIHECRQV